MKSDANLLLRNVYKCDEKWKKKHYENAVKLS